MCKSKLSKLKIWFQANAVFIFVVIFVVVVVSILCYFYFKNSEIEKLGQTGDYFGGILNPIFSFLSFLILVSTLYVQKKEMKISIIAYRKEEFEKRFEKKLYDIKEFPEYDLNKVIEDIKKCFVNFYYGEIGEGKHPINEFKDESDKNYFLDKCNNIVLNKFNNNNIDKVSRDIYYLIKHVDDFNMKGDEEESEYKKYHIDLLKSKLSSKMLQIMSIYWCRTDLKFKDDFKKLIEKYSLLEYMSFYVGDIKYYDINRRSNSQIVLDSFENYLFFVYLEYDGKAFGKGEYVKKMIDKVKIEINTG